MSLSNESDSYVYQTKLIWLLRYHFYCHLMYFSLKKTVYSRNVWLYYCNWSINL